MTFELFEQGPGVYIPALVISLLITVAAYCAYPLLYAKFQNEPITAKRYRRICYFFNLIPMVIFFFWADSSSGWPYVLWTSVFSSVGIKILEDKNLLEDPDNSTPDQLAAPITETDLEYSGKYQQLVAHDSAPVRPKKAKNRFCKLCGSPIDPSTKKCTGCGKQYFRLPARKGRNLAWKVFTLLSVIAVCLCIYRISQLETQLADMETLITEQESMIAEFNETKERLLNRIAEHSSKVASLTSENNTLKRKIQKTEMVYDFCNEHVVVISNDGSRKYHRIGCIYFDDSYFWAYNLEAAQQKGYQPCSYCFSRENLFWDSLTN